MFSQVTRAVYYRYFEKYPCPHTLASCKMIGSALETILNKVVLKQIPKHNCHLTACCLSKEKHRSTYLIFAFPSQRAVTGGEAIDPQISTACAPLSHTSSWPGFLGNPWGSSYREDLCQYIMWTQTKVKDRTCGKIVSNSCLLFYY